MDEPVRDCGGFSSCGLQEWVDMDNAWKQKMLEIASESQP